MALNADKLKAMVSTGDFTFWRYDQDSATTGAGGTAGDAEGTVVASGYFNSVTNNLKKGDVILIKDQLSGGTATIGLALVTSATGAATVTTALANT